MKQDGKEMEHNGNKT